MRVLRLLAVALLLAGMALEFRLKGAQAPRAVSPTAVQIRRIHEEAIAQPFDDAKFAAYLKTLGKANAYYVVEGDLRMTEDEVRLYLVAQSQQAMPADGSATELLVNIHEGRRDFYPIGQRRLTYAVDRASFKDQAAYQKVVKEMSQASRDWEEACPSCGVDFNHVSTADENPSPDIVTFVVRMHETPFAALAFFPHDPPAKRYLDLHPLYLTAGYDSVGLLRHELGHTLGYRHEHAPGIAACFAEGNQQFERLTEYDSESVMHYICSETTGSSDLILTSKDRSGHQKLYGVATGNESAALAFRPQSPPGGAELTRAYAAAAARPMDAGARAAFAALLPRHGSYYILEGDLRVTESELSVYLAGQSVGARFGAATPELMINTYRGNRDLYAPSDRRLTYVVDRASFVSPLQYRRIVEDLHDAMASWESACPSCGIAFTHLEGADGAPDASTEASFIVRRVDAGGAFVASAFFPHTERARRVFEIDQSFFESKKTSRLGVLRHQVGHILGYRHSDIGRVAGCTRVKTVWVPVNPVPADSLMRYICGPEDSAVELTEADIKSHRGLYEPSKGTYALPPPSPGDAPGLLVVRFEGGDVGSNASKVMKELYEKGVLPLGTHTVALNETTESLYASHLQLPPSPEFTDLAKKLNPKKDIKDLRIGDVLRIPQCTFVPGWFYLTFDATRDAARIEEIKKNWAHLEPRDSRATSGGPGSQSQSPPTDRGGVRIRFKRYELRLAIPDPRLLDVLANAINELDSKNIIVSVSNPLAKSGGSQFFAQFIWHYSKELMLKPDGEGSLGGIVGMPSELEQPQCDSSCPEVVLIDSPVRLHPDVIGAIVSGGEHDDPPTTARPCLLDGTGKPSNVADSPVGLSHGTYMAGLIGSRANSFGLVGINPWTRIHSWNSDMLQPTFPDPTGLVDKIDERQDRAWGGGIQIYVVASDYAVPARATPAARINDDSFAKKVRQQAENLLLIVAAGQPLDQGGQLLDVNAATLRGPANLGDQPNVIVVTACEQCIDPNNARLMSGVNFSTTGFVHLAAPGDRIPGPVIGGKYAEGSKTSPATAIVTGVASLMAAKFPAVYRSPAILKRRLMLTSRIGSMMLATSGIEKVAGGFLDPEAALRNPSVHHVQKFGDVSSPVSNFQWQASQIHTFNPATNSRYTVELSRVLRLVHSGSRIVVFESVKERIEGYQDPVSIIRRVGPLTVGDAILAQPLVSFSRTRDNTLETLKLDETTDVLLASVVAPGGR
jgi:Subtilase family